MKKFLFLNIIFILSCSAGQELRKTEAPEVMSPFPVIKTANLEYIYKYSIEDNRKIKDLLVRRENLSAGIRSLKENINTGNNNYSDNIALIFEKENEINSTDLEAKKIKSEILSDINIAVKRVSEQQKCDLVLDISTSILYSDSKYDITDDIIAEIQILRKKSSSVTK